MIFFSCLFEWVVLNAFLSPFQAFPVCNWERKGPFPVANWERIHQFWERIFPGKGSFPKIDESFPSCSLSWERKGPFPVTNRDIRSRAKFRVPEIQTGSIFCLPSILKRILILNPNSWKNVSMRNIKNKLVQGAVHIWGLIFGLFLYLPYSRQY